MPPLATGQHQTCPASTQSLGTLHLQTGLPDTLVSLPPIGQRLQNLATRMDAPATSTMSHGIPLPCTYNLCSLYHQIWMETDRTLHQDWLPPYLYWHLVCTILIIILEQIFQLEHNPLHPMFHWNHICHSLVELCCNLHKPIRWWQIINSKIIRLWCPCRDNR